VQKPPPPATSQIWVLDDSGTPVQTGPPAFVVPPAPPRPRQWAVVIPWWSIAVTTAGLSCIAWRRSAGRGGAFPVTPAHHP
jgi:hypothetical protein